MEMKFQFQATSIGIANQVCNPYHDAQVASVGLDTCPSVLLWSPSQIAKPLCHECISI